MTARVLVLALTAVACGAEHRGRPAGPAVVADTGTELRGERLYQRYCYQCHPAGAAGLGPSLNDKPLPVVAIRAQIRNGVGAMPAFSLETLSDDDVDAIAAYVQELRATPVRSAHAQRR